MTHSAAAATTAATMPETAKLPPWALYGILFGLVGAASIVLWGPIGVSGTYALGRWQH